MGSLIEEFRRREAAARAIETLLVLSADCRGARGHREGRRPPGEDAHPPVCRRETEPQEDGRLTDYLTPEELHPTPFLLFSPWTPRKASATSPTSSARHPCRYRHAQSDEI
jgi:hypothetical protein